MYGAEYEPQAFTTRVVYLQPPEPEQPQNAEPEQEYSDEEPRRRKKEKEEIIRYLEPGKYLPGERLLRKIDRKHRREQKKKRKDNLKQSYADQVDRIAEMMADEIEALSV